MNQENNIETLRQELDRLRGLYTNEIAKGTNNFLLMGSMGAGKSDAIGMTCRAPILVHSFDPGGWKLRRFEDRISEGKIIAITETEVENRKVPSAFKTWDRQFEEFKKSGMFDNIGTYVIDSFTTWERSLRNKMAKERGRSDGILQQSDWQIMGNIFIDTVKLCTALPCDFVLTAHMELIKDDSLGKTILRFKTIPSLKVDIPTLFDEIYVMEAKETSKGIERRLITAPTERYEARTRMGGGLFETREEADFRKLFQKAGRNAEDLETLIS